jgi:single-strand DNA-binding protein
VTERLDLRSWENPDGDKRSKVEITANDIGPSLRWATATITKSGAAPDRPHGKRQQRARPRTFL